MKRIYHLISGILIVSLLFALILGSGCASSHRQRLACSSFSGSSSNSHGISKKQMRKLTASNKQGRYPRLKTINKAEQEQTIKATFDFPHLVGLNVENHPIPRIKSLCSEENNLASIAATELSSPLVERAKNQNIASSGTKNGFGLMRSNQRLLNLLKITGKLRNPKLLNTSAPSSSPQETDKRNLPAVLSIIFGGGALLFLIASLAINYATWTMILLVLGYLLAIAAITLGIIGIIRAIKLKKRFLGLAIAGAGIGLLLLIALIIAALIII